MTIVEFLTARYDEREELALAVHEHQRSWNTDEAILAYGSHALDEVVDWVYVDGAAEHMAANDPNSVLRDIAAKRLLLAEHADEAPEFDWDAPSSHMCRGRDGVGDFNDGDPCHVQRLLALAHDQHPDYDPAWRP